MTENQVEKKKVVNQEITKLHNKRAANWKIIKAHNKKMFKEMNKRINKIMMIKIQVMNKGVTIVYGKKPLENIKNGKRKSKSKMQMNKNK